MCANEDAYCPVSMFVNFRDYIAREFRLLLQNKALMLRYSVALEGSLFDHSKTVDYAVCIANEKSLNLKIRKNLYVSSLDPRVTPTEGMASEMDRSR